MTKIAVVKQDEPEESVVHRVGNWYSYGEEFYALIETGECKAALVSIGTGLLFTLDSYDVVDIHAITDKEFEEISADAASFKYIDRIKIEKT